MLNVTIQDNGGPVILFPKVTLIFWGTSWSSPLMAAPATILSQFSALMSSPYMSGLSEYRGIGYGSVVPTLYLAPSAAPANFQDSDVQTFLTNQLTTDPVLAAATTDPNHLLFVLPDQEALSGTGNHFFISFQGKSVHYAWDEAGFLLADPTDVPILITNCSHELAEACTDPEGTAIVAIDNATGLQEEICDESDLMGNLTSSLSVIGYASNRLQKYVCFGDYLITTAGLHLRAYTVSGSVAADLYPANLNGGSMTDLLYLPYTDNYPSALISNGDGTFTAYPAGASGGLSGQWLVGDFNGDGMDDCVFIPSATTLTTITVYFSQGNGAFASATTTPFGAGVAIPSGLWLVGDFNGDGTDDLVFISSTGQPSFLFLSNGGGTFQQLQTTDFVIPAGIAPSGTPSPEIGVPGSTQYLVLDANGDGNDDLILVTPHTNTVVIWLSQGNGQFTSDSFTPYGAFAIGPGGTLLVGDFDGNGQKDIAHIINNLDLAMDVLWPGTYGVYVWHNGGSGGAGFATTQFQPATADLDNGGVWLVGDFNADGADDLVHIDPVDNLVRTFISNGSGYGSFFFTPNEYKPYHGYVGIDFDSWVVGDFFGDGAADLANWGDSSPSPLMAARIWRSQLAKEITATVVDPPAAPNFDAEEGPGP